MPPAMRRMTKKQFNSLPQYATQTIITYELTIEMLRKAVTAHEEMNPVGNMWYLIGHGPNQRRIFMPPLAQSVFHADNQQDLTIRQEHDGIVIHSDAMIHILPRASNSVKLISEVD